MIRFILNEKEVATHLPPGTLLLDYIRYHCLLTGTKIGCREGDCGACTVLVGEINNDRLVYSSATSCLMALANAGGKHIVTVEGLNMQGLNPIQQALSDEAATQCGFCTPGFVVSLAGFCLGGNGHHYQNALASIDGNICRCTGYKSIERAAAKIAALMQAKGEEEAIDFVTDHQLLPDYFKNIKSRLQELPTNGKVGAAAKDGRLLGGGTDLYVQQPEDMTGAEIHALARRESNVIYQKENRCYMGAAATVTDLLLSPIFQQHFPQLPRYLKLVSSTPIRNMATVAGNFVNASPIGDLTIFFLALNAQIILSNGRMERTLALQDFYKGYKQLDKSADELIKEIFFELPGQNAWFHFEKVSKRTHLDIASVNSAICIRWRDDGTAQVRLSAGGVGPVPMYLQKTSAFLTGKKIAEPVIAEAVAIAQVEVSPISDVRGSADYKRLLLGQLIKAHFIQLFPELNAEGILRS